MAPRGSQLGDQPEYEVDPKKQTNLHSIMVGFNHERGNTRHRGDHIYIPLWSDSIVSVTGSVHTGSQIYIPLWSDSISLFFCDPSRYDTFTFHYGRIQSGHSPSPALCTSLFTFHYGRIQSPATDAIWIQSRYLHSIMVGFNPDDLKISSIRIKFTFHYGRIQSLTASWANCLYFIYIPLWSDSIVRGNQPDRSLP